MSEIKNQDRILEAIDQLRHRKARPDSQRICNFLLRRFCVESKDTQEDLKRLVDAKTVIKVEYKGSISYRNAAKWARYNKVKSSNDFTNIICGALSELIVHEPDYLDFGVPPIELEKYTIEKNKELFSKRNLNTLIKRELKSGNLVKLENGNYSLVEDQQQPSSLVSSTPSNPLASCDDVGEMVSTSRPPSSASSNQEIAKKERQAAKMSLARSAKMRKAKANNLENDSSIGSVSPESMQKDTEDSENATGPNASSGFRPGMRRKRAAKKVFDPSDNNLPKRKRGRPFGSKNKETREVTKEDEEDVEIDILRMSPKSFCYICHQQGSNRQGQNDNLIACRDCTNKAHPKCTERDMEGQRSLLWQCFHCKTCCVCSETDEYETMVICRACDDAYHLSCHAPSVSTKFKGAFLCSRCSKSKVKMEVKQEPMPMDRVSRSTPSPPSSSSSSPLASPMPNSSSGVSSLADEPSEEETVPDASAWTVPQVGDYLRGRGYHLQAGVFEQNEIDGQALLLLKRSDVLTGLAMKLGPALKAYKQVKRLQIRSSDPNLLWAS